MAKTRGAFCYRA